MNIKSIALLWFLCLNSLSLFSQQVYELTGEWKCIKFLRQSYNITSFLADDGKDMERNKNIL